MLAVGHENPDADTLGATLAVCRLVEAIGGRATPVFSDAAPAAYAFMPDVDRIRADPDPGRAYDLLVLSDCATAERVGAVATRHPELFRDVPRIVINHHASNAAQGTGDWVDPDAAATCEMVALLAIRLGVPLDAADGALATALMAGIVTNTATFSPRLNSLRDVATHRGHRRPHLAGADQGLVAGSARGSADRCGHARRCRSAGSPRGPGRARQLGHEAPREGRPPALLEDRALDPLDRAVGGRPPRAG